MEHRYTGRTETSLDVVIYNMRGVNLRGCLCNVSREGMYIRTDGQRIRKGETLDIEVTNSCCLRGWVVHISDDGIGVLFVSPSPEESGGSSPPLPLPDECLNCLKIDG